jgi:hypothetical protein
MSRVCDCTRQFAVLMRDTSIGEGTTLEEPRKVCVPDGQSRVWAVDRDDFERAYAQYTGRDLQNIIDQRLGTSYGQPKISTAWTWYQIGQGNPV